MDFNVSNSRQCVKLPRVTENGVNSNDLNINGMFNREYSFT